MTWDKAPEEYDDYVVWIEHLLHELDENDGLAFVFCEGANPIELERRRRFLEDRGYDVDTDGDHLVVSVDVE